jgi:hypothetical protein
MFTLPHYAEPLPEYSTAQASGRRVMQQTAVIAPDVAGDHDAQRVIGHRRELVEMLSVAAANLRNAVKEWDDVDVDDSNDGASNDGMGTAGDDLAGRARYVVELLKELGY